MLAKWEFGKRLLYCGETLPLAGFRVIVSKGNIGKQSQYQDHTILE